jgi:DNA ligase (NAD+)
MINYRSLPEIELFDLLNQWRNSYYNGTPEVSDALYDQAEDFARATFPTNAYFAKVGAPSPVNGSWPKVPHSIPMGSLNKAVATKDPQGKLLNSIELADWYRSCALKPGSWLTVMDKLDGGSCSLKYQNHKLVQALTRGDGNIGEDITRNVLLVQGVVKQLPAQLLDGSPMPKEVYVRGEIVCTHTDFKTYFPGESNPRNTANGCVKRQTDFEKCRHLTFMCYDLIFGGVDPQIPSKVKELQFLKGMGFRTPRYWQSPDLADVEKGYLEYVSAGRAALNYDIDGLVVCIDDRVTREYLGDLNGRPKGAVAYKFPNAEEETTLSFVVDQVGNSGRITPVATFEEVTLAGAKVTRASLHNYSNIENLVKEARPQGPPYLLVGDRILVSRKNDVIPYVEKVLGGGDPNKPFPMPSNCPSCGSVLIRDGEYLVCRNDDCEAQAAGAVKRWVKKLGVLHFGETLIEALCDAGFVSDPADLYTLDPDTVAELEMGGRRVGATADKAIANLNAKKILPLHIVVGSIGIPLVGRDTARTIVDAGYNSLSKMQKAKISELSQIAGLGDTKARAFVEGFHKRSALLAKLLVNGIEIQDNDGCLNGMSFCFTGFRNADLEAEIEKLGGSMKSGVSKGLTYLVAVDPKSNSGKAQKAAQYGTKVIGIEEAWDLVKS